MLRKFNLSLQKRFHYIPLKWIPERHVSRGQQKLVKETKIRSWLLFVPLINGDTVYTTTPTIKKISLFRSTRRMKKNSKNSLFEDKRLAQTFFLSRVNDIDLKHQSIIMIMLNIDRVKRCFLKKKLKKSIHRAALIKRLITLKHAHRRQKQAIAIHEYNHHINSKHTHFSLHFFKEHPVSNAPHGVVNSGKLHQSHCCSNQQRLY